jgi:hypothetical protein
LDDVEVYGAQDWMRIIDHIGTHAEEAESMALSSRQQADEYIRIAAELRQQATEYERQATECEREATLYHDGAVGLRRDQDHTQILVRYLGVGLDGEHRSLMLDRVSEVVSGDDGVLTQLKFLAEQSEERATTPQPEGNLTHVAGAITQDKVTSTCEGKIDETDNPAPRAIKPSRSSIVVGSQPERSKNLDSERKRRHKYVTYLYKDLSTA